jgi:hypothetical protein
MRFRAPGEHDAQERAWEVVRAAYEQREPVSWPRRHWQPLVAVAVVAAVVAAALSPPGRSVVHSLREAVGVKQAEQGLFSLPAPGQLLVTSREGAWLVHADGSKRLLGRYRDASFSPHGLFIAGTRANELVVVDPKGTVHWTLSRPNPRFPVWTGTRTDTRIAYVSGGKLHVVAGDGTGDRVVGRAALDPPPTWLPGRKLAFWTGAAAMLYDEARGTTRQLQRFPFGRGPTIRRKAGQSTVVAKGRVVLRGTGVFDQVVSSPDDRWLLVSWPTANQWVFVRLHPRKIVGVARITQQFGRDARISGWCCG